MKSNIIKMATAGLCFAMALCMAPVATVKGVEAVEVDIEKLITGTGDAIGNLYNADYETNWANDGEDSEFVAYVVTNAMTKGNDGSGYVTTPDKMAELFYDKGFAYTVPVSEGTIFAPGDIISTKDKVYISLGSCEDGSVLLATTDIKGGVYLTGTVKKYKRFSQASNLAEGYMAKYYKEWWENHSGQNLCTVSETPIRKGGTVAVLHHYFTNDPKGLTNMWADDALHFIENGRLVQTSGVSAPAESNGDATPDSNPSEDGGRNPGPSAPNTSDASSVLWVACLGLFLTGVVILRRKEN